MKRSISFFARRFLSLTVIFALGACASKNEASKGSHLGAAPTEEERATLRKLCTPASDLSETDRSPIALAGWERFNLRLSSYDRPFGDSTITFRCVVLNPTPERALTWILTAVRKVHGAYNYELAKALAEHVQRESGFQFPIAGVVDEREAGIGLLVFRNGIAVHLEGMPLREQGSVSFPNNYKLTSKQWSQALATDQGEVLLAGRQARPSAITPEEFFDRRPRPEKDGHRWTGKMDILRDTYQAALSNDDNPLITHLLRVYPTKEALEETP